MLTKGNKRKKEKNDRIATFKPWKMTEKEMEINNADNARRMQENRGYTVKLFF